MIPYMLENESSFRAAVPVWVNGLEKEMNVTCGFYAAAPKCESEAVIRIAAASLYHLYINGKFVCYGPVRTAHGYHRVDAIRIDGLLNQDVNHIAIEVYNSYVGAFSLIKAPAFLQAEVETDGKIIAYTAAENTAFTALRLNQRIQKMQRFNRQRPFTESYRLSPRDNLWREGNFSNIKTEALMQTESKKLLPRGLPIHNYSYVPAETIVAGGTVETYTPVKINRPHPQDCMGDVFQGYMPEEQEFALTDVFEGFRFLSGATPANLPCCIEQDNYLALDTLQEKSGLIHLQFSCSVPTVLWLNWDELLDNGFVNHHRAHPTSILYLELEPGTYDFQTFDVYSLKYLQIACTKGSIELHRAGIREYRYPLPITADCGCNDPVHQKIWKAAVETFCQNASDIFMDCPGRERAGWLCDSFFIGRVEYTLTGKCVMERQFLENFLLPESFEFLDKGMLPMCYPADHNDENYIPNWAMWFVLQLADYVKRTGDRSLADKAKMRVYELVDFFRPYLNEFGLLEKLPKWVFIEWSKANDFVQDVSFPSNMLYCGMLRAVAELYGDDTLIMQADSISETIRQMSFDGEFFVDNAIRTEDGKLQITNNRSETCQYYAFFFEVATPDTHPELWHRLTTEFGPHRSKLGLWPEIHPSNAFIGNYLRLDTLVRSGLHEQTMEEMKGYFEHMADTTGTLWEHDDTQASCNHGFASYYAYLLKQIQK